MSQEKLNETFWLHSRKLLGEAEQRAALAGRALLYAAFAVPGGSEPAETRWTARYEYDRIKHPENYIMNVTHVASERAGEMTHLQVVRSSVGKLKTRHIRRPTMRTDRSGGLWPVAGDADALMEQFLGVNSEHLVPAPDFKSQLVARKQFNILDALVTGLARQHDHTRPYDSTTGYVFAGDHLTAHIASEMLLRPPRPRGQKYSEKQLGLMVHVRGINDPRESLRMTAEQHGTDVFVNTERVRHNPDDLRDIYGAEGLGSEYDANMIRLSSLLLRNVGASNAIGSQDAIRPMPTAGQVACGVELGSVIDLAVLQR